MKRIIFECIGNIILTILFGLMLAKPFASIQQNNADGFEVTFSIYVAIFLMYFIVFGIARFIVSKKSGKSFFKNSEFTFEDEREQTIVAGASKLAYQVTTTLLCFSMSVLAAMKVISSMNMFPVNINMYPLSIMLFTMTICLAFITYCAKWCIEYKK